MTELPLNPGQQAVADGFFDWLFTDERELCISGPGGVGKTFLMGNLIDRVMPRYYDMCTLLGDNPIYNEVFMTATTNKAAEVLGRSTSRPTETLHSFLGLTVYHDFTTGRTKITKRSDWETKYKKVVFVDESSMIDSRLRAYLLETAINCKIVYVGDHCQLAPIGEKISPIYADNLPFFELTEPMRNSGQPALMAICKQLRDTVKTGNFQPIQIVPGVIDHMDETAMLTEVKKLFGSTVNDNRVLCYTNDKVNRINRFIRNMRGMPTDLTVGEVAVNNSAVITKRFTLKVEDEFEILEIGPEVEHQVDGFQAARIMVRYLTLKGKHGIFNDVPMPTNREHITHLMKVFKQKEMWKPLNHLKNGFPDLRPKDASTVYKAQGSTYDTTLIDLTDIGSCFDPNVVARMLYVSVSRAKNRIIMFGNLPNKYGGLIK